VVFLPGAGLIGLDYLNLHRLVAATSTSVIYDRTGTGWSDPVALPRSAAAVAEELRELLRSAGVPGPYVLVGHSLGGAYARRFAQLFPQDVAGLVMLDPAHEGYATLPAPGLGSQFRQLAGLLKLLPRPSAFYRPMFERMLVGWPEPEKAALIAYHLRAWASSLREARNLQTEVLGEIAGGGALPDTPMIVLVAMGIDRFMAPFAPASRLRELNAAKRSFYEAFAADAPRGEARLLEGAGHSTIHTDRPDAVLAAIEDVIEAGRQSRTAGGDAGEDRRRQSLPAVT
jgi:pimeloyl-ACP methyl ester carboxylesterase